jgi:hypothetical protein
MNFPLPNRFDMANAACLIEFAAAAYARTTPGARTIENASTDTRAVFSVNGDDLIVAFRGTRSLANFVTDVECRQVRLHLDSEAKVHVGFFVAYEGIREALTETLTGLLSEHPDRRVWFTGHSLGGALAKLAALHFTSTLTSVYTFGAPRVGNGAFRDLYNSQLLARTFRVVHADDVVPRVPWLLGSYRHSGHEVFFPGGKVNPSLWQKLPSGLIALARELSQGKIALLADHHVATYRRLFGTPLNPELNPLPVL